MLHFLADIELTPGDPIPNSDLPTKIKKNKKKKKKAKTRQ
jgi:hypothetical protein